jgi:hypothetical protein
MGFGRVSTAGTDIATDKREDEKGRRIMKDQKKTRKRKVAVSVRDLPVKGKKAKGVKGGAKHDDEDDSGKLAGGALAAILLATGGAVAGARKKP